jgi:hypothetical protein
MASTFECLGFALDGPDDLGPLLDALRPAAQQIARVDGIDVLRWEDADSGARLVWGARDRLLEFLLPSCAAPAIVHLAGVVTVADEVLTAAILDDDGSQLTAFSFELEERLLLGGRTLETAEAAVVAFGNSVHVHPSVESYDASPDSLLETDPAVEEDPDAFPKRPLRMAAESFVSLGVFGAAEDAVAAARLSGVVVGTETAVNGFSGRPFHRVRLRTCGFEILMCLSVAEIDAAPPVGGVVTGTSFLSVSIPALGDVSPVAPPRGPAVPRVRRRWGWKR